MRSAASEAIAVLAANGIDRVFGNPGTTEVPLLDATVSADIDFHLCLHEGVAVAMADGYGRATRSVGVVMVHTSVGTANTLANLVNLSSDRSPLLVIAGDKDDRLGGRGAFCEVPDLPGMVRQVTKEAWRVTLPQKLPELVLRGLKVAQTPARGPVFIGAPENYMAAELAPEYAGLYIRRADRVTLRAHPHELATILSALASAERPLIIAGNEVGAGESLPLLVDLAEKFCVPVVGEQVFTTNALNFPTDHPFYHGNFSPDSEVVREADLVVSIGARMFMEYSWPAHPYLRADVRLMQIGTDAGELGKIYPTTLAVLADVDDALHGMHGLLEGFALPSASVLERRRERASAPRRAPESRSPVNRVPDNGSPGSGSSANDAARSPVGARLHPQRLLALMNEVLPDDVVVVDESVLSKSLMQSQFRLGGKRLYFGTSGGGLGWGIPAAVGVQLGMPRRRVVAFVGDGGALFNIQALWTAAHLRTPIVVVIVNNDGYMAVRRGLREFDAAAQRSGRFPGSSFSSPEIDFCAIARGFGARAVSVRAEEQLVEALRCALGSSETTVIDAHVLSSHYH
jgi:benzoylformate decarboxylase